MTEQKLYTSLDWQIPSKTPQGQGLVFSASGVSSPHFYRVRRSDQGYLALAGFSSVQAGWISLGIFKEELFALLACERHDFAYAVLPAQREDVNLIFAGSERTADLVSNLNRVDDSSEIMDMIVDCPRTSDGRLFHRSASFFEATKGDLKQSSNGSFVLSLQVGAREIPLWLLEAQKGTSLSMGSVLVESVEDVDGWRERGLSCVKRSHLLPIEPQFCQWMLDRMDFWGLIRAASAHDSDAVSLATGETLKRILGIPTRRDLLTNKDAIEKLERIDRDFYRDMSHIFNARLPSHEEG